MEKFRLPHRTKEADACGLILVMQEGGNLARHGRTPVHGVRPAVDRPGGGRSTRGHRASRLNNRAAAESSWQHQPRFDYSTGPRHTPCPSQSLGGAPGGEDAIDAPPVACFSEAARTGGVKEGGGEITNQVSRRRPDHHSADHLSAPAAAARTIHGSTTRVRRSPASGAGCGRRR